MFILTLYLILSLFQPSVKTEAVMVGKSKLSRKIPLDGPNRCFVDNLAFYDNNEFELVFKTIIYSVGKVYTYTREVNIQRDANIALGNSVAYLKDFKHVEKKLDFRFEYGENLGIFCSFKNHPYPHKHLPHDIKGKKVKS